MISNSKQSHGVFMKIWLLFALILLNSCSSIFMINKEQKSPAPGKTIIYGQLNDMPGFMYSVSINLYDRKNDKILSFLVKDSLYIEESLPFAYELPGGKYEIFSFQLDYMVSSKQSARSTYYLVKNIKDLKKTRNLGLFVDWNKVYKDLEHDTISLSPNTVVYIGDWKYSYPKLEVNYNKEFTDSLIKKNFNNLDILNSTTVLLNKRAIIDFDSNQMFMTNDIIAKGSTNLNGEWNIFKINNVNNSKWNVQSIQFTDSNLIYKIENNGDYSYLINYYTIISNCIYVKNHYNDLYWFKIMEIDGKDSIRMASLSNDVFIIFKRTSAKVSNVYNNMVEDYLSNEINIPPQIDNKQVAIKLQKNEYGLLNDLFTNTTVYNYTNYSFYIYRSLDNSEIFRYRALGFLNDVLIVKFPNGRKHFILSRGNIKNVDQIDKSKFQIDGMDYGEFSDESGMFSYTIEIKNGKIMLLD